MEQTYHQHGRAQIDMKIFRFPLPIKLRLPIIYSFFQFLRMGVDEDGDVVH